MGLFKSKKEKDLVKRDKKASKDEDARILSYFKNNSDLVIGDAHFDDKHKKVFIKKSILANRKQLVFNYDELVSFTPIFNGGKIKKHHGITRAVAGGLLAGPVGALVGAGTGGKEFETIKRLGLTIYLTDNRNIEYIILDSETKIDSMIGKSFMKDYNDLSAKLDQILSSKNMQDSVSSDPVNEIKRYKELLDDGVISQEEFDAKKKELLNL
ncbi:SHOCT domain-containing protein [Enterococcus hulanensis]|uniref:SHOCT domain-containing protein n=1 Tax=Enterococcus hulanensis TaxID=2559929 RepID=UPI001A8CA8DF|nr:SHOCT domain-containing protein [Enterococcus hulanensis]MBO0456269.1 SHOCT domain-containing protein [Enterococcus hulanensis]